MLMNVIRVDLLVRRKKTAEQDLTLQRFHRYSLQFFSHNAVTRNLINTIMFPLQRDRVKSVH